MKQEDGPGRIWGVVRRVLQSVIPRGRSVDIIGDLEEGHRLRTERLGRQAARRHLVREVASLLLWRLGWRRGRHRRQDTSGHGSNRKEGWTMWGEDLWQDVRFGARALLRRPAFMATAVFVLGLGIGAPTTVFSLVNRIFFVRPAEVQEPHRLLRLYRSWAPGEGGGSLGNPEYEYYRAGATTLSGLAASMGGSVVASYSTQPGGSDQLRVRLVSDNYFDVLGTRPVLGRAFDREENATPGTHPVVILSHGFWTRAFGQDADVIGRSLTLNGDPYIVIGVMPEAFNGLTPVRGAPEAWIPIAMNGALNRSSDMTWWERVPDSRSNWLMVVGRLAPGVTFEAAEANLLAVDGGLDFEGREEGEGLWVRRQFLYNPGVASQLALLSKMLLGVVSIVLLIAAANVAVLLLSRASMRKREIGIRVAVGASRGRIIRQLLAESLVMGLAGGVVGIGFAFVGADLAAGLLPLTFEGSFEPDMKVISVAILLSVLTSFAVGLAPARQAARSNVSGTINRGGVGAGRGRVRGGLVVGQLALSLMLIAGAFLFARSFWAAKSQDLGFEAEDRLVVQVNLRSLGYDDARGRAFIREGLRRVEGVPGVRDVTTSQMVPFRGQWSTSMDAPPGASPNEGDDQVMTGVNVVSPAYFDVMGVEVSQGRPLGSADVEGAAPVMVINEALAEAVWPGETAVGKTLPVRNGVDYTVVGVANNSTYYSLGEEPFPQSWASVQQLYQPRPAFIVHTSGPAAALVSPVQEVLRGLDPAVTFSEVTTLSAVVEDQIARYEVTAVLVGVFGLIALVLACAGLYGVVSFLVSQRTREIGVRMALGADRGRVAREVVARAVRLALLGLVFGLGGAVLFRRFTESLLYGIEPGDPWPLAGASLALIAVTAAASFAPARRATRVDPMEAIRAD